MKCIRAVLLSACLGLGFAQAARADMITNAGFENGNLSGWTSTGNTSDPSAWGVGDQQNTPALMMGNPSYPHSGTYYAQLGADSVNNDLSEPGYLTQSVATNVGATYSVSFYMLSTGQDDTASNGYPAFYNPNYFNASFGSTSLWTNSQATDISNSPGYLYQPESFSMTATASSTNLQFQVQDDAGAGYFLLDDVSVIQTPEPASLALGALGCGYALFRRPRRRRASIV